MATILVVDDDPVAQRVLGIQLRRNGHTVVAARSGEAALQQLAEASCDLAILDIGLPEMGGLTLLRTLRGDAKHRAIPIIMLTASGEDKDCQDAEAGGANAFLSKPASSTELRDTIDRVLAHR